MSGAAFGADGADTLGAVTQTARTSENPMDTAAATPTVRSLRGATALGLVDALLRDREALLAHLTSGADTMRLTRVLLCTIVLAGAALGAVLGSFRGEVQILYAAVKLPLVLLVTAALCAPALAALRVAAGGRGTLRHDALLVLATLALGALVSVAFAPALLLAMRVGLPYHKLILCTVGACALGGLTGVSLFWRGLRGAPGRATVGLVFAMVIALVGSHAAWTLRPYLLRPRTPEPTFVRALEGSLLESLSESMRSSMGRYRRYEAPLPSSRAAPAASTTTTPPQPARAP